LKDKIEKKSIKKEYKNTIWVNWINSWPKSWNHDNLIECKSE
jgi:hypothetical protein